MYSIGNILLLFFLKQSIYDGLHFQEFMVYGDRLMRILAEEALCRLPNVQRSQVDTPCGKAQGLVDEYKLNICLVSVVRSGKELVNNLFNIT